MGNSNDCDKSLMVKELDITIDDTTAKLVHLGLRKNKKRAHLLVSNILGKHIPVNPYHTALSGAVLGAKVWNSLHDAKDRKVSNDLLDEASEIILEGVKSGIVSDEAEALLYMIEDELNSLIHDSKNMKNENFATIGFAETATGLGANVAHVLQSEYHHSTRDWKGRDTFLSFEEEHSHATSHALVDIDENSLVLSPESPMILVDDEFSTGKTLMNIISELHELIPRRKEYYVVSLIDCRNSEYRAEMDLLARTLGISITPITLVNGKVTLPEGILEAVSKIESDDLSESFDDSQAYDVDKFIYPTGLSKNQLMDNQPISYEELLFGVVQIRESLRTVDKSFADTLVLGREEFMYYPQRVAQFFKFHFSSTTRSPIMVFDREDYPVKNGVKFTMDDGSSRFAYNVGGFKNVILFQDVNLSDSEADHMARTLKTLVPNVMVFKPEHS